MYHFPLILLHIIFLLRVYLQQVCVVLALNRKTLCLFVYFDLFFRLVALDDPGLKVRLLDYLLVNFVGNVTEFIQYFLIDVLPFGRGLRLKRQVLLDADFSGVEELFHNAHELYKLLTDDIQTGRPCQS